jgi:hypothetical protein
MSFRDLSVEPKSVPAIKPIEEKIREVIPGLEGRTPS